MDDFTVKATPAKSDAATPMMAQFLEIKAAHPDSLLFYRMGDFYELFFDDAVTAAEALGITLTKRGKHLGADVQMCGVPVHASEEYLHRLIAHGFKVAICEQLEDPAEAKKRGSKAVVKRGVVRLVTPGTLTEDTLLDARAHNFIAGIARVRGAGEDALALAWLDISTGDLHTKAVAAGTLETDLARIAPRELLVSDALAGDPDFARVLRETDSAVTALPAVRFDSATGERTLKALYAVAALDGFGAFARAEIAAAGALVDYVRTTQVGQLPAIKPPRSERPGEVMMIDAATRTNLELVESAHGTRRGSLLAAIDRTVTGPGARALAARITAPLTAPDEIAARLDAVDFFFRDDEGRGAIRAQLRAAPDMARAMARITVSRGSPRDLGAIRQGLGLAGEVAAALGPGDELSGRPDQIARIAESLAKADAGLGDRLREALADDLPALARDGGFIRPGFNAELDDNRRLRDESRRVVAGLQAQYAELAAIKSLKVKFNNVLGYFVEVTAQHGARMMEQPLSDTFIHRQTLASAMRFTTTELADLEARIAAAADKALAIEMAVFADLVEAVCAKEPLIAEKAQAFAGLDVAAALADVAVREHYVRPVVDESFGFAIEEGRHPMVEQALRAAGETGFIANDCRLGGGDAGDRRLWLLTGPNMAGKSTFLRQNALIAVLAQAGCFVPAKSARIGIVDRLFSRVGASDDLARGRSTFMVEMIETAAILNHAGERSLVILDEIGRGTATFDGLSIAWATIEHLHEVNRSRAIFATHYHELTVLADRLDQLANVTMRVKEWDGEVVFLHEVGPGAADGSYGIQVARLAGLPASVVHRAGEVLHGLEAGEQGRAADVLAGDLPLFSASVAKASSGSGAGTAGAKSALADALEAVAPDELTPREALDLIYRLKALAGE